MIAVAATIAAATAVGVWAERRWGEPAQTAARRLLIGALYTLSPFVTFFNVARLHDRRRRGGRPRARHRDAACSSAEPRGSSARDCCACGAPEQGALIASVMQANTGYVGLPLALVLLGSSQLGAGVAYDALVTNPVLFLGVFAVGAAFGRARRRDARASACGPSSCATRR